MSTQQQSTASRYHLAIIGGGLGGLCLAIQAADAGYRVILFEKEQYPFHKVCGEYISMESWAFLEKCGVPLQQWQLPRIQELYISDCKGRCYQFPLPLGGFGISRYQLDATLAAIAEQKGVTLCTNTKVTDVHFRENHFVIETLQASVQAVMATAAYGKRANLDIKWVRPFTRNQQDRLSNYIGVKYHIRYPCPDNRISLHNFKNGYCGISKIEDDQCCLCYLTTAQNLAKANHQLPEMEKQLLAKHPALQHIFDNAAFVYKKPLVISQISFRQKNQVENHMLMVGDASGLITPLCGNGMSMAMHASKIAFEEIDAFLSGKSDRFTMERQYAHRWKKQFATRLTVGRTVQRFFGNPTLTAIFLRFMHRLPFFASWLIRQTHGKPF